MPPREAPEQVKEPRSVGLVERVARDGEKDPIGLDHVAGALEVLEGEARAEVEDAVAGAARVEGDDEGVDLVLLVGETG